MNDNIRKLLVSFDWQITYDKFNVDFSVSLSRQTDSLNEDLLQASSEEYIIDIGIPRVIRTESSEPCR